ncbi:MAG: HAD-IC family P-type ATPase [Thiotrichaceae bacterium]
MIKDGRTLELLKQVDMVVFDKTGTLTDEQPQVGRIHTNGEYTADEVLIYAAAAESKQTHPIAKAILQYAKEQQLVLPSVDETSYKVGYGLTVTINNQLIRVGSIRFLEQENIHISTTMREIQASCHDQGHPMILVALDNTAIGAIELQASLRPGLKTLIHELRQRNIKSTCIISGDHEAPTKKLAEELGIENYYAEVLPEQKAELIKQFQREGKSVCYIGDGINDAIALKQADVSISLSGASTVATDAAQIILMDQNLEKIIYMFDLSEVFDKKIKNTVAIVMIPSIISMGTVILFPYANIGLLGSFIWPQVGLTLGVLNAMTPPAIQDRHHND